MKKERMALVRNVQVVVLQLGAMVYKTGQRVWLVLHGFSVPFKSPVISQHLRMIRHLGKGKTKDGALIPWAEDAYSSCTWNQK